VSHVEDNVPIIYGLKLSVAKCKVIPSCMLISQCAKTNYRITLSAINSTWTVSLAPSAPPLAGRFFDARRHCLEREGWSNNDDGGTGGLPSLASFSRSQPSSTPSALPSGHPSTSPRSFGFPVSFTSSLPTFGSFSPTISSVSSSLNTIPPTVAPHPSAIAPSTTPVRPPPSVLLSTLRCSCRPSLPTNWLLLSSASSSFIQL
jgi:hypothetical protein